MLHGKPCLSHAVSQGDNAQPETMGPAGFFAANLEEYTKRLCELFQFPHLRMSLSRKAIPHAQEYYSLESSIEELSQLFLKVCGRAVPSSGKQRIPYGISPLGFLYAGYLDRPNQIAYHVLTGDIPEEFYLEIVRFFLPQVRTFIDIGANTGLYGLFAAKECPAESKIHCFEPQKECCRILEKTIHLNNWEEKVFIHPHGLSDHPGDLPFYLADSGSSFDPTYNRSTSQIRIKINTLDCCIRDLGISNIDFIKIDVECHEQKVLEGAIEVVAKYRPILFVEIVGNWKEGNYINSLYPETISWLQSRGYGIYRCTERKGRFWNFGTISKVNNNCTPNKFYMFLCIPCERESLIMPQLEQHLKNVNKNLMKKRIQSAKKKSARVLKEKIKKTPLYPFLYQGRNVITRFLKKILNLIPLAQ